MRKPSAGQRVSDTDLIGLCLVDNDGDGRVRHRREYCDPIVLGQGLGTCRPARKDQSPQLGSVSGRLVSRIHNSKEEIT